MKCFERFPVERSRVPSSVQGCKQHFGGLFKIPFLGMFCEILIVILIDQSMFVWDGEWFYRAELECLSLNKKCSKSSFE